MYPFQKIHGTEQPNTNGNINAQTRVWIFGFVLLLVILAGLTYIQKINNRKNLFVRTDSLPGLLAQGFPDDLLLDFKGPKIVSSYSLDYSNTQRQYTAEFSLKEDFFLIYTKYRSYLKQQGYYIANQQIDAIKFVASLYGFKKESDINITITREDKEESDLNITFLKKGGE